MNDCAEGGCVDFDSELVEWNCMATCLVPKGNKFAIGVDDVIDSLLYVDARTVLMQCKQYKMNTHLCITDHQNIITPISIMNNYFYSF
jgi:hypothetical protein